MRSVKMFLKVFSVVILVLAISTVNLFAKEKEKNILLKMPLAFPSTLPILGEGAVYFADLVNSMDDTIKVKIFEPGKLMPAFEIHDAVSTVKLTLVTLFQDISKGRYRLLRFFLHSLLDLLLKCSVHGLQ